MFDNPLNLTHLIKPDIIPPQIEIPKIESLDIVNPNLASEFYKRLTTKINDFNRELENEYEVGLMLVNFGQSITFHVEDLGYWNPSLITFSGHTEDGDPVELIQHTTQISVLLMKLKREEPEKPKKPIGFKTWEEYDQSKE